MASGIRKMEYLTCFPQLSQVDGVPAIQGEMMKRDGGEDAVLFHQVRLRLVVYTIHLAQEVQRPNFALW